MAQKSRLCYATVGARASADASSSPPASATAARRRRGAPSGGRSARRGATSTRATCATSPSPCRATAAPPSRRRRASTRTAGRSTAAPTTARRWPSTPPARPHRVADGDPAAPSRRARSSTRRCATARGSPPGCACPTLGSPKPSHPQVAVDGTGRLFVAWDEVAERRAHGRVYRRRPSGPVARALRRASAAWPPSGPTHYPVMAPLAGWRRRGVDRGTAGDVDDSRETRERRVGRDARWHRAHASAHRGWRPVPSRRRRRTLCTSPNRRISRHPVADHMRHRFDDPEAYAKSFDDPARDSWQMPSRVIDALALAPGQIVADIGAGTGYFSTRLARAAARPTVFAVDIEPAMVAHLTKRAAGEGLANLRAVRGRRPARACPSRWTSCWWSTPSTTSAIVPPISPASGVDCGRVGAWRSSTSARTPPVKGHRRTSGSAPSRSPPRWRPPATSSMPATTSCRGSTSSSTAHAEPDALSPAIRAARTGGRRSDQWWGERRHDDEGDEYTAR